MVDFAQALRKMTRGEGNGKVNFAGAQWQSFEGECTCDEGNVKVNGTCGDSSAQVH